MKVLVTGGAGYIGSITVEQLILARDRVVVFDRPVPGPPLRRPPRSHLCKGDLKDRTAIDAALSAHRQGPSCTSPRTPWSANPVQKPFLYLADNVTNGLNLLQSALEHGVKRFLLSSTANLS
jgi:UDP-glucose 4-epimerase